MYRYVSLALLIAVIAATCYAFYKVMASFILPLFLAALLVVIFRPLHKWILEKFNRKQKLAAFATTACILLIVLLPLTLLTVFAAGESRVMMDRLGPTSLKDRVIESRQKLGLEIASDELKIYEAIDAVISDIETLREQSAAADNVGRLENDIDELRFDCQQLGMLLEIPWPEAIADGTSTLDPWENMARELNAAHQRIAADWSNLSDDDRRLTIAQASEHLKNGVVKFKEFKTKQLGGPVWAWVKELVNPYEDELNEYIHQGAALFQSKIFAFGSSTGAFLARSLFGGLIMIIALYFFLLDGPAMLTAVKSLSPIEDAHEDELFQEFDRVSRAVVVATLLSAVVQGLLAGLGFYLAGLDSVILLTLLTMVLALVPFVGAAAVWVPACLWLYLFEGRMLAAILLAAYGAGVISMADNVIKPMVLHGQSNLHPLWALLSVLGGVTALGPIGILVGPMVVAFLQTLLKILQREISSIDAMERGSA